MHKFGQFIYVKDRKCRVCKAPDGYTYSCQFCDYKGENKFCDHPNGMGRCLRTIPLNGYLKKL